MKEISPHQTTTVRTVIVALLAASLPSFASWVNILTIAAVLLSIYDIRRHGVPDLRKLGTLSLLSIGYVLLEIIGLTYTDPGNVGDGWSSLVNKHHFFVLIPFAFYGFRVNAKGRMAILFTFVTACLLASFVCVITNMYISLTEYDTLFHEWRFSHDRISEPLGITAVYFALFISLSFLIILNYFLQDSGSMSPVRKTFFLLALAYLLVIMVALGARTLTVMLMFSSVVMVLWYAWQRRSRTALIISAVVPCIFALLIVANPVVRTRFADVLKHSYEDSNYGSYFARWKMWEPGLELIRDNLWFGVGTGDHQVELDRKFLDSGFTEGVQVFNMHNQYLETALALGIAGLLLLVSLLIFQFRRACRRGDILYLSFIMLFCGGCLTESFLSRNKGTVFFLAFSFIFSQSTWRAIASPETVNMQRGRSKESYGRNVNGG